MLYLATIAAVTVIWTLAWGSLTVANVLSGVAVAVLLLLVIPDDTSVLRRRSPVRPRAILRFVGYVLLKVVESNVVLSREVVTRGSRINTGVVAVPLPECSDGLITLIANTISLTPGTMPIQVDRNPTVLYVHVLQLSDVEEARGEIQHLADLAYRAFGSDAAIAELTDREEARP
jgi:multicomponent Na+:H+ antiporter subunit E